MFYLIDCVKYLETFAAASAAFCSIELFLFLLLSNVNKQLSHSFQVSELDRTLLPQALNYSALRQHRSINEAYSSCFGHSEPVI